MKLIATLGSVILASLLLLYLATILILPGIVDRDFNKYTLKPPYQVSPQTQMVYNNLTFVSDLHCDALLWDRNLLKRHDYGHVDIPRMIEAKMFLQVFTIVSKTPKNMNFDNNSSETDNITNLFIAEGRPIATWFSLRERALVQCGQLYSYAEKSNGQLVVITSVTNLNDYIKKRQHTKSITAGLLGVEGMHVLEGDIENINTLYKAGVRMMAPVHFFDNDLGGSAHGVDKGGLTEFGKEVIRQMEAKKMIVDLAHSSPQLIDDVLKIATRPIIVSHTGVKGTCDNIRNLSDEHLISIAATGGLIGIAFFEPAVCGTDARATAEAIRYTVDLVGLDHVALGSDFDGAFTMHFDVTGLPLIVEELLRFNFTADEISLIMGGNVKNFLLKNLPLN